MHYLARVARQVDRTHPKLGNLVAVALLCAACRKLLIIVSPPGCGKSTVTDFIASVYPEAKRIDRMTVAGLKYAKKSLTDFSSVVVVDDLAMSGSDYVAIMNLVALAQLTYSHSIRSMVSEANFLVENFYGSAVTNIQPSLFRAAVRNKQWEIAIRDKSIRYYHLYRPVKPNYKPIEVEVKSFISSAKHPPASSKGALSKSIVRLLSGLWTLPRRGEHISDLLYAVAGFECRSYVTRSDYKLLLKLLTPLALESVLLDKPSPSAAWHTNLNRLYLLVEYATHGQFGIKDLMDDYNLSQSGGYVLMGRVQEDWVMATKNPTTYAPTDELRERLKGVKL